MSTPETRALLAEVEAEVERRGADTLEAVQAIMDEVSTRRNRAGREDFFGLSPEVIMWFLHAPYDSPQFVEFPPKLASEPTSRLCELFVLLTDALGEKGVKPTATGNLPRNLVREIAKLSMTEEDYAEMTCLGDLRSEADFGDLEATRHVAQMAGVLRKVNGRFVVTQVCKKQMSSDGLRSIHPRLLKIYTTKFNWFFSYHGNESPFIQQSFLFTLYMLHRFGDEWRPPSFYGDAYLKAFPHVLDNINLGDHDRSMQNFYRQYNHQCLNKFCLFLGLAEAQWSDAKYYKELDAIRKLPTLGEAVVFHV